VELGAPLDYGAGPQLLPDCASVVLAQCFDLVIGTSTENYCQW
jgi:hypothetical protein